MTTNPTLTADVPSTYFSITITSLPEDDAVTEVTHLHLSMATRSFEYEAVLPDPTDEYEDDELDGEGDVVASPSDLEEDDPSPEDILDEAVGTIHDMISPEQLLTLTTTVSPAAINNLKQLYEMQDVGADTEVLITYYSEYGDPVFYHLFTGCVAPVRKLQGTSVSSKSVTSNVEVALEMDVYAVRTFLLENPSTAKPLPLDPTIAYTAV
jgi:hypothetical protein